MEMTTIADDTDNQFDYKKIFPEKNSTYKETNIYSSKVTRRHTIAFMVLFVLVIAVFTVTVLMVVGVISHGDTGTLERKVNPSVRLLFGFYFKCDKFRTNSVKIYTSEMISTEKL